MEIEKFLAKTKEVNLNLDFDLIEKACRYARKKYQGLERKSGQSYFDHCLEGALDLAEMKLDSATVATAILHEAIERAHIAKEELVKEFGPEIAFLVEGVTHVGRIKYTHAERSAENFRKLFLAMAQDIRVILIKLINQLHGLETLHVFPEEKQKRIATQVLEIYAPIARRLGMGELNGQLEDMAFPYVHPEEYKEIVDRVKDKYERSRYFLQQTIPLVKNTLSAKGIRVIEIQARTKHYYSLYKKLLRYDKDWHKIYDLIAVRLIVPDVEACYAALGIIHKRWKPLIGRIKDYIAMPKTNGYQSLHTTVFCEGGKIVEFQIRTPLMHEKAEYGIAAHWHYSEQRGLTGFIKEKIFRKKQGHKFTKELLWVKQLQEWQKEQFASPQEFINSLKIDFLKDRIFVFTPKGDVFDLPEGATAVDLAYRIHSDIGDQCVGASIDGKFSSVSTPLRNGQVVEIVTQKNKTPNVDWLRFVKTTQARSHIKAWLRKRETCSN